jgi:hypothetical protein
VPQLEPEQAPHRPAQAAIVSHGTVAASQGVCVCGLRPCVCQGDSDEASSDDGNDSGAESEGSLKTDSDWEDEPQPQHRQPPRPPLPPGESTGNISARSGGYTTRGNASARGFQSDVAPAAFGAGAGSMRPGQLRNVYRETSQSQQMGQGRPGPPAHAAAAAPSMPGKLRSSAGGHPTMPQFGVAAGPMTASAIARGPRPPTTQSFAGSFGRPRPAGVPRMQSFIFPQSATAPDLSIMAAQQREAMQAIAAASGLDLAVSSSAAAAPAPAGSSRPPHDEPSGPATPVRMASHMSFGRPRPHGVPQQPEPEPEQAAPPPRGILKMPTNASFDANQMKQQQQQQIDGDSDEDFDRGSPSRSRSRSRSRRSRSQSRERSRSRPREPGTRVLSARSSGSRSSRSRNRRRDYSDDEYSADDYSDYSSEDGYSSAGSARSYQSRRSHRGGGGGGGSSGRSRRRNASRYSDDEGEEQGESSSSRRRNGSGSRSRGKQGRDMADENERERDSEKRRRRRKERRERRKARHQQEDIVDKVRGIDSIAPSDHSS